MVNNVHTHLTKHDKMVMFEIVKESLTVGLPRHLAIQFINNRLASMGENKKITQSMYSRYVHFLKSPAAADVWLAEQAHYGFAIDWSERIATCKKMLEEARQEYLVAKSVEESMRDVNRIDRLRDQITNINNQLASLQLGSPVIARMKAEIDAAKKVLTSYQSQTGLPRKLQLIDVKHSTTESSEDSREDTVPEQQYPELSETAF